MFPINVTLVLFFMANQIKHIKNVTDFISMLHQIQFDPDPSRGKRERKRKKEARCIAKGFIIYYLQLANLIVRLTQLLAAKIEAQIAQMPRAGKEREQLGNFWFALRCPYCSESFRNN